MVDLLLDRVLTSTQLEKIFVQVCEARTLGDIELAELAKTRICRRALLTQHGLGSPMSVA